MKHTHALLVAVVLLLTLQEANAGIFGTRVKDVVDDFSSHRAADRRKTDCGLQLLFANPRLAFANFTGLVGYISDCQGSAMSQSVRARERESQRENMPQGSASHMIHVTIRYALWRTSRNMVISCRCRRMILVQRHMLLQS